MIEDPYIFIPITHIKSCLGNKDAAFILLHILYATDEDGMANVSVRKISKDCNVEYSKTRRIISHLISDGILEKKEQKQTIETTQQAKIEATQQVTLFRVCKSATFDIEKINNQPTSRPTERSTKRPTKQLHYKEDEDLLDDIKPRSFKCRATSIEEVQEEIDLKGYHVSAREFFDYYEGSGWKLSGGKKVTDWKKCLVTWETRYRKEHTEETETYRKNKRLLEQYDGDDKGYGGFIHYIADTTKNIIYAVEFPTEEQYRFINANHRSAIRNVLPMIDGDKFLSRTNFYTAFFTAMKNLRLSGSDVTVESEETEVEHIRDMWNEICVQQPRVEFISGTRLHNLSMRLAEMKGKVGIEEVFRAIASNAYLNGANANGWVADFDWLVSNDTNWIKVIEGKYNNNDIINKAKYDTIAQSQRARVEHETRGELLRNYVENRQRESTEADRYVFTGEGQ